MAANAQGKYGPFSVSEVEECFRAFDLDDNDFVGSSELRKVYQHIGENVTDEDIDEIMKMCDQDGDGQISFQEFARMVFRHAGPPKVVKRPKADMLSRDEKKKIQSQVSQKIQEEQNAQVKQSEAKVLSTQERADRAFVLSNLVKQMNFKNKNMDQVQNRFYQKGRNSDGKVNFKDFCFGLGERENPVCQTIFRLFDTTERGTIDYREFLIALANIVAKNKEQKIRFAFEIFDVDRNGSIDRGELIKILKSTHMSGEEQVSRKADAIMRQADGDDDNVLSFVEFQEVARKFPNLIFPNLGIASRAPSPQRK